MINRAEWLNISHPFWWVENDLFYRAWRRVMCRRGYHLFDEVLSYSEHTLICDACQLGLVIQKE